MLLQMSGFPSIVRLNNMPLGMCVYTHTYIIFYIHSFIDGHLGCFHVLPSVYNAAVKMRVQMPLQDLLDIYPEGGLLGHMAVLFLIFSGLSILLSIVPALIYIPTNIIQRLSFLNILQQLIYFVFK